MTFAAQPLLIGMVVVALPGAAAHASASTSAATQLPGLLMGLRVAGGISNTYIENADGANLHTYASSPTDGSRASWSPDGNWVVFTNGSGEGTVSHPDGSAAIPSAAGGGSAFTPDSSKLVFGQSNNLAVQLATMPATCPLYGPSGVNNCSTPLFSTDTGGNDYNVSIASSGIVYFQHDTMQNLQTVAFSDIWTDHGTSTPGLLIANGTDPSVSPDGTRIAFVRKVGSHSQIFVQAADGTGTAVQETTDAAEHTSPSWRADGTGLFYTYNPSTQDWTNVVSHQLTFVNGSGTDSVVPGNLFNVTQQPLPAHTTYHAYGPKRLLDTRSGAPVPPNGTVTLTVDGAQGLPAAGITSVVLNVTATQPTSNGFLTAYAEGQPQPTTSNVNFGTGRTVANLVTVPVVDGKVTFRNNASGTVHVIADAFGYYTGDTTGDALTAVSPTRVLDTRTGIGVPIGKIGANGFITVKIAGAGTVPPNATAAILNLTTTNSTANSFMSAYPAGTAVPATSNLNFAAGATVPNLVVVPIGANGSISVYNNKGQTDAVADLMGYFTPGTATGSTLDTGVPTRVLDTRSAIGVGTTTPVGPNSSVTLTLPGLPAGTTAVILNVTVTDPTASGFLTVYPGAGSAPGTSNLNFTAGMTVPNLVVVAVTNGQVSFANNGSGTVHVVADLFGAYVS